MSTNLLTKRCGRCKLIKPVSEFCKSKRDGYQSQCKECGAERHKENPHWKQNSQLRKLYGIDTVQKQKMMAKQGNACPICKKQFFSLGEGHVDHCHTTNKIRDILCGPCNRAFGILNESQTNIKNLLKYAKKHANEK